MIRCCPNAVMCTISPGDHFAGVRSQTPGNYQIRLTISLFPLGKLQPPFFSRHLSCISNLRDIISVWVEMVCENYEQSVQALGLGEVEAVEDSPRSSGSVDMRLWQLQQPQEEKRSSYPWSRVESQRGC